MDSKGDQLSIVDKYRVSHQKRDSETDNPIVFDFELIKNIKRSKKDHVNSATKVGVIRFKNILLLSLMN